MEKNQHVYEASAAGVRMHDMQRWAASMAMCPDRRLAIPDRARNPDIPHRIYTP
jgi:hypothetical protein